MPHRVVHADPIVMGTDAVTTQWFFSFFFFGSNCCYHRLVGWLLLICFSLPPNSGIGQ